MPPKSKFPYCTMELLNSECANALEYVWRYEGLEEFAFAEKAGELLYWIGYADAMRKFIGNTKKILRSYADPMPF